jgi:hypothetical protein
MKYPRQDLAYVRECGLYPCPVCENAPSVSAIPTFDTALNMRSHCVRSHGVIAKLRQWIRQDPYDPTNLLEPKAQCMVCSKWFSTPRIAFDHISYRARDCRRTALSGAVLPLPPDLFLQQLQDRQDWEVRKRRSRYVRTC